MLHKPTVDSLRKYTGPGPSGGAPQPRKRETLPDVRRKQTHAPLEGRSKRDQLRRSNSQVTSHALAQKWRAAWFPQLESTIPSSRMDAVILEQWMDGMMDEAAKLESSNPAAFLSKNQQIFSTVVHDLIRQVSTQCSERGMLLARVWVRYMELFDKLARSSKEEIRKLQLENEALKQRLGSLTTKYEQELNLLKKTMHQYMNINNS